MERPGKLITALAAKPRTIFLADSLGALLSGLLLWLLYLKFNDSIGMPARSLGILGSIAGSLFIYSGICFLCLRPLKPVFLKITVFGNLGYCLITVALLISSAATITPAGIVYFSLESAIILCLAFFEWKVVLNWR